MSKINLKLSALIVLAVGFIFVNSFAKIDGPKFITGKVIYSDNLTPVNEGFIKVFRINSVDGKGSIIATTEIQTTGEFKLPGNIISHQQDRIKIMAYPNDYDNLEPPFNPAVVEMNSVPENKTILIEVERTDSKKMNESAGESKIILKQNFPNPFNPTTIIRFELPQTSNVTLKIFNMNGEAVSTLVENKFLKKGLNEFEFDASSFSSGIYIYTLTTGNFIETKKMMLLK